MSKEKKQTPQQAFNQFLFESMMDKLRAVELYEKEVAGFSKQISQHITDHREHSRKMEEWMAECQKRVEGLDTAQGFLNKDRYELAERVKAVEQACRELRAHRINPEKVIADIKALEQNLAAHHERMNRHDTRISDLEETAESLSETVDQPSTCKCEAGNQMLKRIGELEEANAALWEGGTERDAGMLSLIQRLEVLEKTTRTYDKIADVGLIARNASIAQAAAIETLQLQMKNLLPQINKVMETDKKPRIRKGKVSCQNDEKVKG